MVKNFVIVNFNDNIVGIVFSIQRKREDQKKEQNYIFFHIYIKSSVIKIFAHPAKSIYDDILQNKTNFVNKDIKITQGNELNNNALRTLCFCFSPGMQHTDCKKE